MGNPRGVKRDFEGLEKRRLLAVKLFAKSLNNNEIGRRLKVSNQTVSRWRKEYQQGGSTALRRAGVTLWNFYFQIFEQTIKSEQIIQFLQHLLRYIDGDILLIWDRLPAHRSRITQQFIRDQKGRLETDYLPPYAPELNPVEYIWAHCKHHELPNVCAKNLWDLSEGARRSLKRMRRRPRLITAFWKQASLFA
jgi:transposase